MKYKLTQDDLITALILHQGVKPIIFAVLLVGLVTSAIIIKNGTDGTMIVPMILVGICSISAFLFFDRQLLKRRARKQFSENIELHAEVTYELEDDMLCIRTEYSQAKYPREFYINYKMNDKVVLLYRTSLMFNIMPRKIVDGDAKLSAWIRRG